MQYPTRTMNFIEWMHRIGNVHAANESKMAKAIEICEEYENS